MFIIVLIGISFLLSWGVTWLLIRYAIRNSLLDIPNARSSHDIPTPRGGGLAVVIVFLAGLLLLGWLGIVPDRVVLIIVPPALLVAVIGFLDDKRHVSARKRLLIHGVAAVAGLYFLDQLPAPPWFSGTLWTDTFVFLFFLMALVWVINLNNFMDGIDGIASMEAICVAGGAAAIIWMNGGGPAPVSLLLLLVAAVSGFLAWNWPPARIFMGDAGSGFLGLNLGLLALITSSTDVISIWSWVILYGVFVVDATYTLFSRICRGERFYEAHRSHAYQILARRFQSHKKITLGVLVVNMFWLFPIAVVSSRHSQFAFPCFVAAITPLLLVAVKAGAGKPVD